MRVRFALAISAILLSAAFARAEPATPTRAEEAVEQALTAEIDRVRSEQARSAPHLKSDDELLRIARARSDAMAHGTAPFAHDDGNGNYPAIDMVKQRFGPFGFIGENIYEEWRTEGPFDAAAFAAHAAKSWMESEEHRDNILSPDYDSSGIGVVVVGDKAFATQVFRGPPPPPERAPPPKAKKAPSATWLPGAW